MQSIKWRCGPEPVKYQLPMEKTFAQTNAAIARYAIETFQPQDEVLKEIITRAAAAGLPDIHVSPMDGLHLEVIARSIGAKKIVEIGTLAGYSGVCLARALPKDGKFFTFEYEAKHAKIAAETFQIAGIAHQTEIFIGAAIENLKKIESQGPFDLIFIDADKISYPAYLEWAATHLRVGGIVLADNTFAFGMIANTNIDPKSEMAPNVNALRKFNQTAATDKRFRSTILPTGEGLTMAVKVN